LRRAHVVYHAGPAPDQGRALEIVRAHLRPQQTVRIIRCEPMSALTRQDRRERYRRCVDEIAADCGANRDVVFITEGDPALYSTAAAIWPLLAEFHPDIVMEV